MRQVPQYGIIGDGRVARHFCHYFSLLGISYRQWARAHHTQDNLIQLSQDCQSILLLINDDAIETFIRQYDFLLQNTLIHCSGSLNTDLAFGAHPLMTFSDKLYELDVYQQIAFIIDEEAPVFTQLFPQLANKHYRLKKELKPRYHSLCVLAANGSCLLWQKLFSELASHFDIPSQAAHALLKQQMMNLLNDSNTALTGPLIRNDKKTITNNLQALQDDAYQTVYQSLVQAYQAGEKKS